MEQNESTDFDFFDTPRKPQADSDQELDNEKQISQLKSSKHIETPSNSGDNKKEDKKDTQRSSSSLSESSDKDDYSSDSVSSLSDSDDSKSVKNGRKNSHGSQSSGSTRSSSYQSNGKSGKASSKHTSHRKVTRKNDSGSDSDITLSKSSVSGSNSSSYSDRRKKTKTDYKKSKHIRESSKKKNNKKEEDSYSSSAYSDGEDTSKTSTNGILKNTSSHNQKDRGKSSSKQAWGVKDDYSSVSQNKGSVKGSGKSKNTTTGRPKTAKHGRRRETRSPSPGNSDSDALSDSDITDVSPMDSPRNRGTKSRANILDIGAGGDGSNAKARFKPLPVHDRDYEEDLVDESEISSASGIDLKILMKAVGELEKKKRVEANSRRVMFAPMTLKRSEKSNYTFDKDRSHDIDRENDRLLKEIVKQVQADRKKQYFKSQTAPKTKLTPSAINREKDMRRIESENINFLKRLQKVKATSTISRNNQLREYENTKLHGIPIATLHPVSRAGSRSQLIDSFSSLGSRTRSMTSLHSVASTVRSTSSKRSSRPASATKRIDLRPEWDDRW